MSIESKRNTKTELLPVKPEDLIFEINLRELILIASAIINSRKVPGSYFSSVMRIGTNDLFSLILTPYQELIKREPVNLTLSSAYLIGFLKLFEGSRYLGAIERIEISPFQLIYQNNSGESSNLPMEIDSITKDQIDLRIRPEILASILKLFQDKAIQLVESSKIELERSVFGFRSEFYEKNAIEEQELISNQIKGLTSNVLIPGKFLFYLIELMRGSDLALRLQAIDLDWKSSKIYLLLDTEYFEFKVTSFDWQGIGLEIDLDTALRLKHLITLRQMLELIKLMDLPLVSGLVRWWFGPSQYDLKRRVVD